MAEQKKSLVPGVILIALGILFLANELGFLYLRWRHIYPLILLALGVLFFTSVFTKKDRGAAFPATVLLVLGVFFFLRNFGLFAFDFYFFDVESFWPIVMVAFGLGFVVLFVFKPEDWGVLIPGGILLFFGGVFLLETSGLVYWRNLLDFWPVILIAIGASIVLSSLRKKAE